MDVGDSLGVHDWKLLVVEALDGRERLVQEVRQIEERGRLILYSDIPKNSRIIARQCTVNVKTYTDLLPALPVIFQMVPTPLIPPRPPAIRKSISAELKYDEHCQYLRFAVLNLAHLAHLTHFRIPDVQIILKGLFNHTSDLQVLKYCCSP